MVNEMRAARICPAPAEAGAQSALLPAGPATPNPYLENKPNVSRQEQQLFNDAKAAMAKKQWPQAENLLTRFFWFRLMFFLAALPGGVPGILSYLICWLIIPRE